MISLVSSCYNWQTSLRNNLPLPGHGNFMNLYFRRRRAWPVVARFFPSVAAAHSPPFPNTCTMPRTKQFPASAVYLFVVAVPIVVIVRRVFLLFILFYFFFFFVSARLFYFK